MSKLHVFFPQAAVPKEGDQVMLINSKTIARGAAIERLAVHCHILKRGWMQVGLSSKFNALYPVESCLFRFIINLKHVSL